MRVLVTGATGFIGRHLCRELLDLGFSVRGAFRTVQRTQNTDSRIDWVQVPDVSHKTEWDAALRGVSAVVHLAAVAHKIGTADGELRRRFHAVNVDGTRRLAHCVARMGDIKRLILVSSIGAVATDGDESIRSAYGQSKKAAEDAVKGELQSTSTDWCILRPTLVYGPGNPGNMDRLFRLIETGLPLPFGSIRNRRNFLYVGNLVSAIGKCLFEPAARHKTFSLSDGDPVSTPELVRSIADCKSRKIRLVPVPVPLLEAFALLGDVAGAVFRRSIGWDSYSVQRLCGSLTVESLEIQEVLGWNPPFSFKQGLKLTLTPCPLVPHEL